MATISKHVVLFPFPGHGHLAAFLSLAGVLHRALPEVAITVVSTSHNIANLRRASSVAHGSFLGFHELPFVPADHGLPAGCESSDGVPGSRMPEFLEALESLQPAFDDFIAGTTAAGDEVVCVVSDPFLAWTVTVARRRGCAHAFFASCGAFGSAVVHSLWSHLPVRPDEAGRILLPEYPDVVIDRSQVSRNVLHPPTAVKHRVEAFFGRQISLGYKTDALLINTVEEFEPTGLAMLRRTFRLPVIPIGPLVRASTGRTSPETDANAGAITSFLDSHPPSSVLYISFGSQFSIQAEHMAELAAALEATGRPFVWAMKPPDGHNINGEIQPKWLPDGFEERVTATKKGLLLHGWAPQVGILAHHSTGAFLSHCGWNSVLESVTHGVPIIGWPLAGEQFYNAKMLDEEWGVCLCVEVTRGNMDTAIVDKGKLVAVVETVMSPTAKAAEMRQRARVIKEIMEAAREDGHGSSANEALEEFFKTTKLNC
uniref:Glycosyltransferase n=1 Tax=Oryza punctata TaxID=4537 RepID=A0A0E0KNK4_ORYPU